MISQTLLITGPLVLVVWLHTAQRNQLFPFHPKIYLLLHIFVGNNNIQGNSKDWCREQGHIWACPAWSTAAERVDQCGNRIVLLETTPSHRPPLQQPLPCWCWGVWEGECSLYHINFIILFWYGMDWGLPTCKCCDFKIPWETLLGAKVMTLFWCCDAEEKGDNDLA